MPRRKLISSRLKPANRRAALVRYGLSLVLVSAAAYVLASHWETVRSSLDAARGANLPWLGLALLLMALTFCIAAGIYTTLALHPLRYLQTVLVELATAVVNKLLPAGLGGLGLHGVYLYKRGHTAAEATVVVSLNNLLGIAAHLLLLGALLAVDPAVLHQLRYGGHQLVNWRIVIVVLVVLVLVLVIPPVRRRIIRLVKNLLATLHKFAVTRVLKALLLALVLTTTYTLILLCSARAIGVQLGLLQIFIVFSAGMLASTATPTPGGLVGAEAGLFAGFVAYGVSSPLAGAAVLVYRLITYWLPLLPGLIALSVARRKALV